MKFNFSAKNIAVLSSVVALVSFIAAGLISGYLLPYQDPTPELLREYNDNVNIYMQIWNVLCITFLVSLVVCIVSTIKLLFFTKSRKENKSRE